MNAKEGLWKFESPCEVFKNLPKEEKESYFWSVFVNTSSDMAMSPIGSCDVQNHAWVWLYLYTYPPACLPLPWNFFTFRTAIILTINVWIPSKFVTVILGGNRTYSSLHQFLIPPPFPCKRFLVNLDIRSSTSKQLLINLVIKLCIISGSENYISGRTFKKSRIVVKIRI